MSSTFRCFLGSPVHDSEELLAATIGYLEQSPVPPEYYTIQPGYGSRSRIRKSAKRYSSKEIVNEVSKDSFDPLIGEGFIVQAVVKGEKVQIHLMPPAASRPFQDFGVYELIGEPSHFVDHLLKSTAFQGRLSISGCYSGAYAAWQRCNQLDTYLRKYGANPGLREYQDGDSGLPSGPRYLDTSKNPGRISSVNGMPIWVSANMWLGAAFWKYAPCTKEEVLKEAWLEILETPQYLYLKAYPEPFTKPDGEQGRIQRRLWNLLFHQDCEWPPGAGGVA